MFKTNEYFDGKVKSLAFSDKKSEATLGVMAPGEYEFGTSTIEVMTVITGELNILLPDCVEWQIFGPMESFTVEENVKFKVKVKVTSSYLCRYFKKCCGNCSCS
ncbi:MAG: pyrimidine/purine nucleoside phosphorylase [Candidatus Cloacimonadales bacterium]|nr:pyrimidine/purine nucleoside phosphorylase [Candidatus Cloacimonadales bacterium]